MYGLLTIIIGYCVLCIIKGYREVGYIDCGPTKRPQVKALQDSQLSPARCENALTKLL